MERMMELLRERNLYLEKFSAMNEHELINFGDGNFENVEEFYNAREKVLDLIHCIDLLIDEEVNRERSPVAPEARAAVEALLRTKNEWVTSILAQDLQVLSYIEKEKTHIIKELQATNRTRKAVSAYRGAGKDRLLDEKA